MPITADSPEFREHLQLLKDRSVLILEQSKDQLLASINGSPVSKAKTVLTFTSDFAKKAVATQSTVAIEMVCPKHRGKWQSKGEDPDQTRLPLVLTEPPQPVALQPNPVVAPPESPAQPGTADGLPTGAVVVKRGPGRPKAQPAVATTPEPVTAPATSIRQKRVATK